MKVLMSICLVGLLQACGASQGTNAEQSTVKDSAGRTEYLYRCEFQVSEGGGSIYRQVGHLVTLEQGTTQLILSTDYPSMLQARITSWQMDGANSVRHLAAVIVDPSEPMLPVDNGMAMANPGDTSLTAEVNSAEHYAKVECVNVK